MLTDKELGELIEYNAKKYMHNNGRKDIKRSYNDQLEKLDRRYRRRLVFRNI